MRILVTGGCGFIGSNFLNLSVPRYPEHHFLNLDALTYAGNLDSLAGISAAQNYEFRHVDLMEFEAVTEVIRGFRPELVVHLAAETHVDRSIFGPRACTRVNVQGTANLLEACRTLRQGDVRFHHVSTDEVYGPAKNGELFKEDRPYNPSSPYAASKAASNHLVQSYHRTYGMPVTITNASNTYGPYQFPEKLIPLVILNLLEQRPLPIYGTGENIRNWTHVVDHCEAIWAVINRGRVGEAYNVSAGAELTNIATVVRLCHLVADALDTDAERYLSLITYVSDRPGHDHRYAVDSSKIRTECKWLPTVRLEAGLKETIRWYLDSRSWLADAQSKGYDQWVKINYEQRQERP